MGWIRGGTRNVVDVGRVSWAESLRRFLGDDRFESRRVNDLGFRSWSWRLCAGFRFDLECFGPGLSLNSEGTEESFLQFVRLSYFPEWVLEPDPVAGFEWVGRSVQVVVVFVYCFLFVC